jgi:hypothetical protein
MADQDGSGPDGRTPGKRNGFGESPVPPAGIVIIGVLLVLMTTGVVWQLWSEFPSCEVPGLSVTSIEPVAASSVGGDKLLILGDGFEPGVQVRFGSTAAAHVDVESRWRLSVTAPPHPAGAVDVVVVHDGKSVSAPAQLKYADPVQAKVAALASTISPVSATTSRTSVQTTAATSEGSSQTSRTAPTPSPLSGSLSMSSVMPATISVRGGQPVTIIGSGFREGLRVLFDGVPARAVRVDGSRFLLATTPSHAAGPVEVIVADDQSLVRLGGTVTYACPPVPDRSMFLLVLLAGALGGLVHALRSFHWYVGQRELVWSWTPMYLLLPITGATLAFVFFLIIRAGLYTPQGEASLLLVGLAALVGMFSTQAADKLKDIAEGIFTKARTGKDHAGAAQPPVVTAIVPQSGPIEGSTWVTIKGSGFVNGTSVQFGGVPASDVRIKDKSTMRVLLPNQQAAGAVEVRVVAPGMAPAVSTFTYKVPIGKVTDLKPTTGPKSGGHEVKITGDRFSKTSTVLFGDRPATRVTFASATELQVTTPSNDSGAVDVRVDNGNDIVGVLNNGYTYEA